MRLHFTRNNKLGSRIIRALTGENVSHVAMEQEQFGVVIHATPQGVDIDSVEHFHKTHQVVTTLEYIGGGDTRLWERRALMAEGSGYDIAHLFLLGLKLVVQRTLGLAIPPISKYMARNKYICTEFVEFVVGLNNHPDCTPGELGTYLLSTGQWRQV